MLTYIYAQYFEVCTGYLASRPKVPRIMPAVAVMMALPAAALPAVSVVARVAAPERVVVSLCSDIYIYIYIYFSDYI